MNASGSRNVRVHTQTPIYAQSAKHDITYDWLTMSVMAVVSLAIPAVYPGPDCFHLLSWLQARVPES